MILATTSESWTGKILYSDAYAQILPCDSYDAPQDERPLLNRLAAVPILGHLGAAARIGLSVIHIIGHIFAALVFWDRGHLYHAAKGGTELLRGLIEIIPIVGRVFSWTYDAQQPFMHNCSLHRIERASFFIIKIQNPNKLDKIDNLFAHSAAAV